MPTVLVTGATGGLGEALVEHLTADGYDVVELSRRPRNPASAWRLFDLSRVDAVEWPASVSAVVHCAHDFTATRWEEMERINVQGSLRLFERAQTQGCSTFIFISSIAAFDGARANYGRAKRLVERGILSRGGICVRPGLIYGGRSGVVEKVRAAVVRGGLVPLLDGGRLPFYPIKASDVCSGISKILADPAPYRGKRVVLAPRQPVTLRALADFLGRESQRPRWYLSVPSAFVWLAAKAMESVGLKPPFSSDAILGLRYQNPDPFQGTDVVKGLEIARLA